MSYTSNCEACHHKLEHVCGKLCEKLAEVLIISIDMCTTVMLEAPALELQTKVKRRFAKI